jgi:Flp pilus assembly protein TadD
MSIGVPTASVPTVPELDSTAEFTEGVKLLKNGYAAKALVHFRRAFESQKQNPYYMSFLGLSMGYAERKWHQASELCETAVHLRRKEIQLHLNLAELYAAAGRREQALYTLDVALTSFGNDTRLKRARNLLEKRRSPVLWFLSRGHFLNRELGKFRHRLLNALSSDKS